ncbi:tyrosine-type recombinase/integrase [Halorussus amylolyticus]|uniref:tyrosine-type recombinase/integrase n=1 Tax=Halorussus amylolyticus TaxID=1126242 RepID=UPI00104D8499|nr:phage integrase SAM-like domain-containing protein [Halorussus amylolyticus]
MPSKNTQPLDGALDDYLTDKSKGNDSGNYRRNAERVVGEWLSWTHDERSTYTFATLDVDDLEAYARHLKRRTNGPDGIAASTARKYFDYVRAYLTFCQKREYLTDNPAAKSRATGALPDDDQRDEHHQQLWTPKQRKAIIEFVNKRAHDAVDERGSDALAEVRDRAFVATIAYSGVRGGEVLRDRNDDRRNGVRWKDADLDTGTMNILEKGSQAYRDTGVPAQALRALDRWHAVFDPPSEEWPVFPTFHAPSLAAVVVDGLSAEGYEESDIEAIRDGKTALEVCYEYDIAPPALTTAGARSLMKRLSAAADVPDLDTENGEYLELHGGRRGAGDTLVREKGWEQAQKHLLHADPKTTMDAYSHISAEETADEASDAFDAVDR